MDPWAFHRGVERNVSHVSAGWVTTGLLQSPCANTDDRERRFVLVHSLLRRKPSVISRCKPGRGTEREHARMPHEVRQRSAIGARPAHPRSTSALVDRPVTTLPSRRPVGPKICQPGRVPARRHFHRLRRARAHRSRDRGQQASDESGGSGSGGLTGDGRADRRARFTRGGLPQSKVDVGLGLHRSPPRWRPAGAVTEQARRDRSGTHVPRCQPLDPTRQTRESSESVPIRTVAGCGTKLVRWS